MKALKYAISLTLGAGMALTASCGGSTDDAPATNAGTGTGGGNSQAGGKATAGANSSAGASTTAGAPAGGSSSVGGTTGEGGAIEEEGGAPNSSAGSGGSVANPNNPMACPAAAPAEDAACTINSQQTRCNYTGLSCRCRANDQGGPGGDAGAANGGRHWECDAVLVCPTTKPTAGGTCTINGTCQYEGNGACACTGNNTKTWQCFGGNGNNCPAEKPAIGATCTPSNNPCTYGQDVCGCLQEKWACTG